MVEIILQHFIELKIQYIYIKKYFQKLILLFSKDVLNWSKVMTLNP